MNDDNFHGLPIKILSRRTTQTSDLGNLLELALTKESTEEKQTKERTNERKTQTDSLPPWPTGVRLLYKLAFCEGVCVGGGGRSEYKLRNGAK